MIFRTTPLGGCWVIETERIEDSRGFFARSYCREEFERHGLDTDVAQCNVSFTRVRGTLRGMHFQLPPHEEAKLVRCTNGALYDVVIDLRLGSPTFMKHFAIELTAANRLMLFIPKGFAHGFQTLADETEVFYQMSSPYVPNSAAGIRYDDRAFGISWPLPPTIVAERDLAFLPFDPDWLQA